jgi:hypothetical protein
LTDNEKQRALGLGLGAFAIGISISAVLLIRQALQTEHEQSTLKEASEISAPLSSSERARVRDGISQAIFSDAIAALEKNLGELAIDDTWGAVLELRAFGPKARPGAIEKVRSAQSAALADAERAPQLFKAEPSLAMQSALLEARALDASQGSGDKPDLNPTLSDEQLALRLEADLLSRARESERLVGLADTRLDLALRQDLPLEPAQWQLAAARGHATPAQATDAESARRLWARLVNSPFPTTLLEQALRTEALASAAVSGVVEGDAAQRALDLEVGNLVYLVNTDWGAPETLESRVAKTYALRALRLCRRAMTG